MLVLNFHRVEPATGLEITRVAPGRFRRFLDLIRDSDLRVCGPGTEPLDRRNQLLITFDDGLESVSKFALPELQRQGWGAVVFLIAGFIGKTDDWDIHLLGRARSMMDAQAIRYWKDAGIEFGSHTVTHADLTALGHNALSAELEDSRSMIEQVTGCPARFLSYPFGRHNRAVREASARAGYQAAFVTGGRIWAEDDLMSIPRVSINGLTSLLEFRSLLEAAADGGRNGKVWRRRWHGRLFESLNAGSAATGNWRRALRSNPPATDSRQHTDVQARTTTNEMSPA